MRQVDAVKGSSYTRRHLGDWQKLSVQRRRNMAQFLSLIRPIPVAKRSVLQNSKVKNKGEMDLLFKNGTQKNTLAGKVLTKRTPTYIPDEDLSGRKPQKRTSPP